MTVKMNSFFLKGNICYSISKTELKTLSGYVVCSDGKCAGVFEELPDEYKDVDYEEKSIHHICRKYEK